MMDLPERLAGELTGVARLLEDLAVNLCKDPVVFARHAGSLQRFDEVTQIIGEVATVLRCRGTQTEAIAAIRLEAMRHRMIDGRHAGETRVG